MAQLESQIDPRSEMFSENSQGYERLLEIWSDRMGEATAGGRQSLVDRHHARGKILVRDRIDRLIDPGTAFLEFSPLAAWGQYKNELPSAGIVTGIGIVSGTPCVIIANDGRRALDLLEGQPNIDLIIMDVMMPVMNGYETTKRIREHKLFWDIPIIALTAKAMPEDKAKCMAAGASDYLAKPVDEMTLLSMLRVWLYR